MRKALVVVVAPGVGHLRIVFILKQTIMHSGLAWPDISKNIIIDIDPISLI